MLRSPCTLYCERTRYYARVRSLRLRVHVRGVLSNARRSQLTKKKKEKKNAKGECRNAVYKKACYQKSRLSRAWNAVRRALKPRVSADLKLR